MLQFINEHFGTITAIFAVIAAIQTAINHFRGRRIEKEFHEKPAIERFRERGVSGRCKKPFGFSGASHVLDVVVTDDELWIKGIWPIFTDIGSKNGLTHKVPLSNIKRVETSGKKITICMIDQSDKERQIELYLRKPRDFISAIT